MMYNSLHQVESIDFSLLLLFLLLDCGPLFATGDTGDEATAALLPPGLELCSFSSSLTDRTSIASAVCASVCSLYTRM